MKIIVVSDTHINKYERFDEDGSRLSNTIKSLELAFELAGNVGAKFIIHAGDLYDSPRLIYTEVMDKTHDMFERMSKAFPEVKLLAITGNHDLGTNSLYGKDVVSAVKMMAGTHDNIVCIDQQWLLTKDILIYGIRYYKYKKDFDLALDDAVKQIKAVGASRNILVIHQSPNEAEGFIEEHLTVKDNRFKAFDIVLCGHIHKHQKLSDNFYVVGSPLYRDLADAGQDKGYLILDAGSLDVSRQIVDFPDYSKFIVEDDNDNPVQEENSSEFDYSVVVDPSELIDLYLNNIEVNNDIIRKTGISLLSQ